MKPQTKRIMNLILLIGAGVGIGLLISIIFFSNMRSIYTSPNTLPTTSETIKNPTPQINPITGETSGVDRNDILRQHFELRQNNNKLTKKYWDFFDEVNRYERQLGSQPDNEDLEELYRLRGRLTELDQIRHNSFSELYNFSKLHNIPL